MVENESGLEPGDEFTLMSNLGIKHILPGAYSHNTAHLEMLPKPMSHKDLHT